jgi:hypothetical protein
MPAPIIDTTTSVLGFRQGEAFIYQPATTNSPAPTSWAWSGLPPGVSANTTTGRLTGPATAEGVFLARVTATNGDGTSSPVIVPIGIYERSWQADGAVAVNIDVRTGLAYPHGVDGWKAGDPVFFAKDNDHVVLDVGFTADGGKSLILMDPLVVEMGLKELDQRSVIEFSDGTFTTIGDYDQTRYRIVCFLDDPKVARALRNYSKAKGAEFDAMVEIKWQQSVALVGGTTTIKRSSQTFAGRLIRKVLAAS